MAVRPRPHSSVLQPAPAPALPRQGGRGYEWGTHGSEGWGLAGAGVRGPPRVSPARRRPVAAERASVAPVWLGTPPRAERRSALPQPRRVAHRGARARAPGLRHERQPRVRGAAGRAGRQHRGPRGPLAVGSLRQHALPLRAGILGSLQPPRRGPLRGERARGRAHPAGVRGHAAEAVRPDAAAGRQDAHGLRGQRIPGGVAGYTVRRGGAARPADRRGRHADGVHGGRVPAVEPSGCLLRRRGAPHPARQPQPARHARRALLLLAVLPAAAAARRQVLRVDAAGTGAPATRGAGPAVPRVPGAVGRGGGLVRGQRHVHAARRCSLHPDGHLGPHHDAAHAGPRADGPPGDRQVPGAAGSATAGQVPGAGRARPRLVPPAALQPTPHAHSLRKPALQRGHAGGDAAVGRGGARALSAGGACRTHHASAIDQHDRVTTQSGGRRPRQRVQQQQRQDVLQVLTWLAKRLPWTRVIKSIICLSFLLTPLISLHLLLAQPVYQFWKQTCEFDRVILQLTLNDRVHVLLVLRVDPNLSVLLLLGNI